MFVSYTTISGHYVQHTLTQSLISEIFHSSSWFFRKYPTCCRLTCMMIMLSQGLLGKSFGVANIHGTEYRTGWVPSFSEIMIPAFRLVNLPLESTRLLFVSLYKEYLSSKHKDVSLCNLQIEVPNIRLMQLARQDQGCFPRSGSGSIHLYTKIKADKFKYSHRSYWVSLNWGQHYVRFCSPNVAVADFFHRLCCQEVRVLLE